MKAYTDLEQSKVLSKILPPESVDMCYEVGVDLDGYLTKTIYTPLIHAPYNDYYIPCWSLSALINIIPQEIFDGEYIINITEGINNRWILTYDHYENRNHSYYGLSTGADNLIDCCVEMIIKLKERDLL